MLDPIADWLVFVSSLFGIVINALLAPIILRRSTPAIGHYKYLLLLYTLNELCLSILSLIERPVFRSFDVGWIMHSTTSYLDQFWSTVNLVAYSCCFAILVIVVTYSFLYRYFVFCKPESLIWFTTFRRLSVLFLILAFVVTFCVGQFTFFGWPRNELNLNLTPLIGADMSTIGYLIAAAKNTDVSTRISTLGVYSIWSTLYSVSSMIVIYAILNIKRVMQDSNIQVSVSTRKIQNTLMSLLYLQTIFPLIFCLLPCLLMYVFPYLNMDSTLISYFIIIMLPMTLCIDPLLILLFIKEYRMVFYGIFCYLKTTTTITQVTSSTTCS